MLCLYLEGSGLPAATGTLELAASAQNTGSLVLMRAKAEVTDSLTSRSGTSEDQGVGTSGSTAGQLVQSDSLTASLNDAGTGTFGETKGGNSQVLGSLQKSVVVSNSTDNNDSLTLVGTISQSTLNTGNAYRGTVDLRKEKLSENDLVEAAISTASKETIKFHKQLQIRILRSRSLTVAITSVLLGEVVSSHGDNLRDDGDFALLLFAIFHPALCPMTNIYFT